MVSSPLARYSDALLSVTQSSMAHLNTLQKPNKTPKHTVLALLGVKKPGLF